MRARVECGYRRLFFSLSVSWERREDELYERLSVAYQNRQVKKEKKEKTHRDIRQEIKIDQILEITPTYSQDLVSNKSRVWHVSCSFPRYELTIAQASIKIKRMSFIERDVEPLLLSSRPLPSTSPPP